MAPPEKQASTPQSIVESFTAAGTLEAAQSLLDTIPTTKAELVALKDAAAARSKELQESAGAQINASLAFLEQQLDVRLKEFEKRPIDAVGNVLGDAVSGAGNLAGKGIKASGEQMGKAFDTAKEIVNNEVKAFSEKSGWERAQQLSGLAAIAVLVGYPIYKLAEKISNAGKKEGEKPGFFRQILKATGIFALSTAAVNFLGPRVLAAQQAGGKQSPDSSTTKVDTPKTETAKKDEKTVPEKQTAPDAVNEGWQFGNHRMCVINRNGQRLLSVNKKVFNTNIIVPILGAQDVSKNITTVQRSIDGGLAIAYSSRIGNGLAEISQSECQRIADSLAKATSLTTLTVQTKENGAAKERKFEFTPEISPNAS